MSISYEEYLYLKGTDTINSLTYSHYLDIIKAKSLSHESFNQDISKARKMSYDSYIGNKDNNNNNVITVQGRKFTDEEQANCNHEKYSYTQAANGIGPKNYTCSHCDYKWTIDMSIINEEKIDKAFIIDTNSPLAEELNRINKIKIEKQLEAIFKILPQKIQDKVDIWERQSIILFDEVFTKQLFEIGSRWEEPGKCIKELQEWSNKQGFKIISVFSNKCPNSSHVGCVDPCRFKKAYGIIFKF